MTTTPTRTLKGLLTRPGGAPFGGNGKTVSIRRFGGNFVDGGTREIVKSWSDIPIADTGLWTAPAIECNEQVDGIYTSYTTVQEAQGLAWAFYLPVGDGSPVFLGTLPFINAPGTQPVQYGVTQADFDAFVASLSSTYARIIDSISGWATVGAFALSGSQAYDATFGTLTGAAIVWPDAATGVFASTGIDSTSTNPGGLTGFTATHVSGGVTLTATAVIPRNGSGQVSGDMTVTVA